MQVELVFPLKIVYEKRVAMKITKEEYEELSKNVSSATLFIGKALHLFLKPRPLLVIHSDTNDLYIAMLTDNYSHDFYADIAEAEKMVSSVVYVANSKDKGYYKLTPEYFTGKTFNDGWSFMKWIAKAKRSYEVEGLCINPNVLEINQHGVSFSGYYTKFETIENDIRLQIMRQASLN